ncbi:hypothetical protein ACFVGY_19000 [Streptomyces sp. NPDC127106]|uniref:hypothetical protein n=1 Tax=Streptomyces sp. NPDC127106 TaxID=3345360 RepID=UPI00363932D9
MAYGHLALVLQMEAVPGEPGAGSGPAYVLERWDAGSGVWRAADLRIANDVLPYSLVRGGTGLARDAVWVERFRIRATVSAPVGNNPVMVSLVDTDRDARVAYASVALSTRPA